MIDSGSSPNLVDNVVDNNTGSRPIMDPFQSPPHESWKILVATLHETLASCILDTGSPTQSNEWDVIDVGGILNGKGDKLDITTNCKGCKRRRLKASIFVGFCLFLFYLLESNGS